MASVLENQCLRIPSLTLWGCQAGILVVHQSDGQRENSALGGFERKVLIIGPVNRLLSTWHYRMV